MSTADTFEIDLAQEPERLEDEAYPAKGGGRYWPHLVYAAPLGFRPLTMDLTVPHGTAPRPLVVFIHGGAWFLGSPKYSNPTLRGVDMPYRLHEAGYAVARISYRLSGEAHWPTQLHDCKAAIRYLRQKASLFDIDPERIAVLGESAGGHLAAMTALTGDNPAYEGEIGVVDGSSRVSAAINWYGVMDLERMRLENVEAPASDETELRPEEILLGSPGAAAAEAMRAASPVAHVSSSAPPFLHQHGDHDRIVSLNQAESIHAALLEAGVHSELEIINGADHCFWGAVSPAIMDGVVSFLRARV